MNRFLVLFAVAAMVTASFAQRTIPLNIEQLVRDAGVIVDATVVKTETGKDQQSGLLVTWVTVDVLESFYGAKLGQMTFKQYGGEADGIANYPKHLPRYTAGERSLLFLTAPSTIGMQSPVGMQQGKFMVVKEGTAKTRIKNLMKNPTLFNGVSTQNGAQKRIPSFSNDDGSMDFEEFTSFIRSYVQQIKQ
ncbi:MAG: hypothetical protein WCX28_07635 [Bacteriovoracaceae bacterium]